MYPRGEYLPHNNLPVLHSLPYPSGRRLNHLSRRQQLKALDIGLNIDAEEAERIVSELIDPLAPPQPAGALDYHIAMAYAGLGDADAAFRSLDRGYAERGSFMIGVKTDPGFASLHSDPRWVVLLRRMGLAH